MKNSGLLLAIIMVAVGAYAADIDLSPETTTVSNIEDLRILLRKSQKEWMAISPPSTEMVYWDSRNDGDVFVDWAGFKPPEKKSAIAILDHNLIPRYEIHLWEDPETGIITIANMYYETMATLKPEKGFS